MNLQDTINQLAVSFVDSVVDAIAAGITDAKTADAVAKASPLLSKAPSGRLKRRSAADIGIAVARVVGLLRKAPDGMRAEEIREALDLDVREVPRIMKQAIANREIVIVGGQKRATTYGTKKPTPSKKKSATKAPKKRSASKKKAKK